MDVGIDVVCVDDVCCDVVWMYVGCVYWCVVEFEFYL